MTNFIFSKYDEITLAVFKYYNSFSFVATLLLDKASFFNAGINADDSNEIEALIFQVHRFSQNNDFDVG